MFELSTHSLREDNNGMFAVAYPFNYLGHHPSGYFSFYITTQSHDTFLLESVKNTTNFWLDIERGHFLPITDICNVANSLLTTIKRPCQEWFFLIKNDCWISVFFFLFSDIYYTEGYTNSVTRPHKPRRDNRAENCNVNASHLSPPIGQYANEDDSDSSDSESKLFWYFMS